MKAIWRYLFRQTLREKLPQLPRTLSVEFDPAELDYDMQLILMTGRARDVVEARKLMEQYGAKNAAELLGKLPPPPRVNWRARLRTWLMHLEGSYATDPHRNELKDYRNPNMRL